MIRLRLRPDSKSFGGRLDRLLARRDERVDAPEQAIALRPSGRITEPFGVQKRRHGHGLSVPQRQIRERRKARLEAVDDVEPAECEREREVRTCPDRHADPAAARDWDCRA